MFINEQTYSILLKDIKLKKFVEENFSLFF